MMERSSIAIAAIRIRIGIIVESTAEPSDLDRAIGSSATR
jgi:hypothetical protein